MSREEEGEGESASVVGTEKQGTHSSECASRALADLIDNHGLGILLLMTGSLHHDTR